MVRMALHASELHASRRSRIRRLPWESAIGRSATSPSSAMRATDKPLPARASASAQPTGPPPAMATSTRESSAAANEGLDGANRFGRRCGQYLATIGRHDDVVFDAHADVPERLRDVVGGPDVAARLDRQGHPGIESTPFASRLVLAGVVDVEAEPMSGAVDVETLVVLGFDHLF